MAKNTKEADKHFRERPALIEREAVLLRESIYCPSDMYRTIAENQHQEAVDALAINQKRIIRALFREGQSGIDLAETFVRCGDFGQRAIQMAFGR
tara:strand:- start:2227 stop:2511 length:285 start_codon:yes stop_codon:yes gene_type:complete